MALVGLWWLVATAPTTTARVAAWVYGLAGVALYTVSSTYHVFARDGRAHEVMQRLDHATIYVLIAGSFTPICLLGITGPLRYGLLGLVWGGAIAGICIKVFAFSRARVIGSALYLVLGLARHRRHPGADRPSPDRRPDPRRRRALHGRRHPVRHRPTPMELGVVRLPRGLAHVRTGRRRPALRGQPAAHLTRLTPRP